MKLIPKLMIILLIFSLFSTLHAKRGFFERTWDILPFTNNSLTEYTTPVPTGDIVEFDKKETSEIIKMSPQKAVEYVEGRKRQIAPAVYINDLLLEGEGQIQKNKISEEPKVVVQKYEDNTKEVLALIKEFLPEQTVQPTSPQVAQQTNIDSIANEITLGFIGILATVFVGGIFALLLSFGIIAYFYAKFKESKNKLEILESK